MNMPWASPIFSGTCGQGHTRRGGGPLRRGGGPFRRGGHCRPVLAGGDVRGDQDPRVCLIKVHVCVSSMVRPDVWLARITTAEGACNDASTRPMGCNGSGGRRPGGGDKA